MNDLLESRNSSYAKSPGVKEIRTTFFTVANRAYEIFVLPYIASVLFFNDDARVEICLENTRRFEAENARALAVIRQYFGEGGIRWLLRDGHFSTVAGSVRFLETPKGPRTRYVYISDIDILILQPDITDFHVARMADTKLPYRNVMQPSKHGEVLTGRHFSQWDAFYPQRIPEGTAMNLDRLLLTEMVRAREHGLPPSSSEGEYHPICGIHTSPNQISRLLVQIRNKQHFMRKAYRELCESPAWQTLFPMLAFQYRIIIEAIELGRVHTNAVHRR